jgi:hypothetical protein
LGGGGAGVELVDDETVVFVQTAAHLQLAPQLLQICEMAFLEVEVEFIGVAFAEVVLGEGLHRFDGLCGVGEALEMADRVEAGLGLLQ